MTQNSTIDTDERLAEGTIIDGRYEIVGHLGRGGFAHVYKARHVHLDREIALKILEIPRGPGTEKFQARFLQEAKIAAKIKHPNVVDVFDFGVANDLEQPYLAMDYLVGHDLEEELVRNGPMEPKRAMGLFIDTMSALGEGHRLGIVHKDLKPSNLYLSHPGQADERLIILDFGIARVFGESSSQMTQSGSFTGTPAYLAPEYIESQIVTPALDVYQMGLIFIETLTAIPAVSAGNSMAYLMAHCQGHLNIPQELEATELGRILKKATLLNPKNRFANATEFCSALQQAKVPRLPFVGSRTMPLGFGNRGRLDSGNVLSDTSEHTPAMQFESAVMVVQPPAPALEPVAQGVQQAQSNLRGLLIGLALLVASGVGLVATLHFTLNSNDAVELKPQPPVDSVKPTFVETVEPVESPILVVAADTGVDVTEPTVDHVDVVKVEPPIQVQVVKKRVVPKVDKPLPKVSEVPAKPEEKKSVLLIAP